MSAGRQYITTLVASVAPVIFVLWSTPLFIEVAGLEQYGVVALVWSIVAYLQFLDFGLGRALNREVATATDSGAHGALFWTALSTSIVILFLASALLTVGAAALHGARLEAISNIAFIIWNNIAGIIMLCTSILITSVCVGFIEGLGRFKDSNIILVISSFLFNVCPIFYAVHVDASAHGIILAGSFLRVLFLVPTIVLVWALCEYRRPIFNLRIARNLINYGGWLALTNLITPILETADRILTGAIVGPAAVAQQAIAYNLVRTIRIAPLSLYRVIFPRFSRDEGVNLSDKIRSSIDAFSPVMAVSCSWAMVLQIPFVSVWISPELAAIVAPIGSIMFFGLIINAVAIVPYASLQASGRARIVSYISAIEVIPYIGVLFFLSHWFGIIGAAAAWSARVIIDGLLLTWFSGIKSIKISDVVIFIYSTTCFVTSFSPQYALISVTLTTLSLFLYYVIFEKRKCRLWRSAIKSAWGSARTPT